MYVYCNLFSSSTIFDGPPEGELTEGQEKPLWSVSAGEGSAASLFTLISSLFTRKRFMIVVFYVDMFAVGELDMLLRNSIYFAVDETRTNEIFAPARCKNLLNSAFRPPPSAFSSPVRNSVKQLLFILLHLYR